MKKARCTNYATGLFGVDLYQDYAAAIGITFSATF